MSILKLLLRINLVKTVLFNFKVFPFKTAIHLPVCFFGHCQVSAKGSVALNIRPHIGILRIGENQSLSFGLKGSHSEMTYFNIRGILEIHGDNIRIANGCKVYIKRGGRLCLMGNNLIQNKSKIHCSNHIVIGEKSRISWESQVFDTNMHYLIDSNGVIKNNKGAIFVGNNCWIGNRCTIQKGTVLPDYMVVASNSVVNKDFSALSYGIVAGIPAKLIKSGSKRLFDYKLERRLDEFFWDNPEGSFVDVPDSL